MKRAWLAFAALLSVATLIYQSGVPILGSTWKGTAAGGCTGGLKACDAGNTVQASGHTCTIASVALSLHDSVVAFSGSGSLAGTITGTWNGNALTENGSGVGDAGGELHAFKADNQTAGTGSVVLTKTNSADDSLPFNCAAMVVAGLTTHAMDQSAEIGNGTQTNWTSGGTAPTTAAAEVWVGGVMGETNTGTTVGAWQNGFTRFQRVGQSSGANNVIDYAAQTVASTGSSNASVTGNVSVANFGFTMTFK